MQLLYLSTDGIAERKKAKQQSFNIKNGGIIAVYLFDWKNVTTIPLRFLNPLFRITQPKSPATS